MDSQKPNHCLLLFCYGEDYWTQLSVLAFLSAQSRLDSEIPGYRTVIVTDRKRRIMSFFGNWVEIIELDQEGLKQLIKQENGHLLVRLRMMAELMQRRDVHLLSIESDCYFEQPPLELLKKLEQGHNAVGINVNGKPDKAVLGLNKEAIGLVRNWINELENGSEAAESIPQNWLEGAVEFSGVWHYGHEMSARLPQIKRFFERHYYREIGELFSMVSLWTPDKWHLEDKDLPEELL